MRNHCSRSLFTLCCAVLAGGLACKDATAPDPSAILFDRVRGTYELSVVLDSHTYTDSCTPSSSGNPYANCHDTTVAVAGRRMHGFVTLADTLPASEFTTSTKVMYVQVPAGTLTAVACDTCSSKTTPYPTTFAIVDRDNLTFGVGLEPGVFLNLEGSVGNDEITGKALSAGYLGAGPQDFYTGTFVAKRQ